MKLLPPLLRARGLGVSVGGQNTLAMVGKIVSSRKSSYVVAGIQRLKEKRYTITLRLTNVVKCVGPAYTSSPLVMYVM